ncbi:MAG: copper-binding protein [Pseudomonadota bacterium]
MMKFLKLATLAVPMLALIAAPSLAQEKKKMDHSGHGSMKMEAPADVTEAEAKAKINTVDSDGGKVNVTHAPVPELGWPKMTMDLPVTRRVDLSAVKPGADVTIKLKKGRDNQFRIIGIKPAE